MSAALPLRHLRPLDRGLEGADGGRLGGGGDAEQDYRQHEHCEDAERHHRRGHELQHFEACAVHPPVVADEHRRPGGRAKPEPEIELRAGPELGRRAPEARRRFRLSGSYRISGATL